MKQHITRAYNSFEIDDTYGILHKISRTERLADEIEYHKRVSSMQWPRSMWFPRFVDDRSEDGRYQLLLEYYAYDNLGNLMVKGEFDENLWRSVAKKIDWSLNEFSKLTAPSHYEITKDYQNMLKSMYLDKTLKYYEEFKIDFMPELCKPKSLIINGKRYMNFEEMLPTVEREIDYQLLGGGIPCMIHGDLCFSNILYGTNPNTGDTVIKYVDPRGRFGVKGIYGDNLYDLAKLRHSYEGLYEYIIYDQFELTEKRTNNFEFKVTNDNHERIKDVMVEVLPNRTNRTRFIEALIFIGMCSRHYDSRERQKAMYLTGIKLLNEILYDQ